jgi:hypothetical protein
MNILKLLFENHYEWYRKEYKNICDILGIIVVIFSSLIAVCSYYYISLCVPLSMFAIVCATIILTLYRVDLHEKKLKSIINEA